MSQADELAEHRSSLIKQREPRDANCRKFSTTAVHGLTQRHKRKGTRPGWFSIKSLKDILRNDKFTSDLSLVAM